MNAKTIVRIALGLVFVAALFYWRDVWGWVSAKTWDELAGDILGFCLKWFYLAIFGWLAMTIPHYIKPWLKLARVKRRNMLRAARRGQPIEARVTMPKVNKNEALAWMMNQMARTNASPRSPQTRSAFGERAEDEIQLRF